MDYRDGGITMTQLALNTGLSVSRVSRLIAAQERQESQPAR
jgi:Winged helix-turn-helix DNA-binding